MHEGDIDGHNAHDVTPKRPVFALEASNGVPFGKHHTSNDDKQTGKDANAGPNALGGALNTSLAKDVTRGTESTQGADGVRARGASGVGAVFFDGAGVKGRDGGGVLCCRCCFPKGTPSDVPIAVLGPYIAECGKRFVARSSSWARAAFPRFAVVGRGVVEVLVTGRARSPRRWFTRSF